MNRFCLLALLAATPLCAQTVYVSRMWHNHQPLYWPEWNTNGSETNRVEYAWDSITLKPNRSYTGSTAQHPENNLTNIFGLDDRRNAYQSGPRNSLANLPQAAGFCMSYSGSLIDNIRQLGGGSHLGYGSGWDSGNREARLWTTPSGSSRMDLLGFTYHHSLSPLLPKEVFRKELQIFKQAWWKAWGGNSDLSDHSKGFFPTEMAFSRHMVDVLVDEGYEWAIVASHHLSRTCPTYFDQFNLPTGNYGIYSSPPNPADLLGPSPTSGWWYSEPNPGNAAWNVSPYAYQLHKAQHINPETGASKTLVMVPSDDVLSYRYGYANEGIGKIQNEIAPFATDSTRPALVMPATDGDNAWGGGSSSWNEATPQLFNDSANAGYQPTAVQDFVNSHAAAAPIAHIEDGAWIFPESCYGSPYFLKWIEPPVAANAADRYPNTVVDMETPGFALKFWAWAPVITGANWVETAEQVLSDEGGSVADWKIQAPYDWNGTNTNPNDVELAWHIYLGGLDSGFNYYGGLGNDDEVKAALATTRAIEKLQPWFTSTRLANDRTPPSVLKPQRFPYNPGGYTFGWFNSIPGGDTNYLKQMPSEFYIWTHAYDISDISSINLKIRIDNDGTNPLNSTQNETYLGGSEVGAWQTIAMTERALPNTQAALNAASNNGQINYFISPPELADYYFVKIDDTTLPGYENQLLDYYIEATDTLGNTHKSDIQHVYVGQSDITPPPPTDPVVSTNPEPPVACEEVTITYDPTGRNLENESQVYIHLGKNGWVNVLDPKPAMTLADGKWSYTFTPDSDTTVIDCVFTNAATSASATIWDNNDGSDWHLTTTPCENPTPVIDFTLDGQPDSAGFLQVDSANLPLYAAVRGDLLYLATRVPHSANDHYLFVSDTTLATPTSDAPWAKAGTVAFPASAPFLGAEADNSYAGWTNSTATTEIFRDSDPTRLIETTINIADHFGTLPAQIHLAALAYPTADGTALAEQSPTLILDNGNVDQSEILTLNLADIRDEDGDGNYDSAVTPELSITSWTLTASEITLTISCTSGENYQLLGCDDCASWQTLGEPETATSDVHTFTISRPSDTTYFLQVISN